MHTWKPNRQDVVRTVNQVYAAIVATVMAAKSHPNLYVCHCLQTSAAIGNSVLMDTHTKIPHTKEISKAVGTILKMIA